MVKGYSEAEINAMHPADRKIFKEEFRKIAVRSEFSKALNIPDKEKAPGWKSRLWSTVKTAAMLLPTAYFAYNVAAGISNAMIDDTPLTMYDYMIVDQAKQIEDILTNSKLKMHYKFNSFNG